MRTASDENHGRVAWEVPATLGCSVWRLRRVSIATLAAASAILFHARRWWTQRLTPKRSEKRRASSYSRRRRTLRGGRYRDIWRRMSMLSPTVEFWHCHQSYFQRCPCVRTCRSEAAAPRSDARALAPRASADSGAARNRRTCTAGHSSRFRLQRGSRDGLVIKRQMWLDGTTVSQTARKDSLGLRQQSAGH
jgi:hypothetical protein